MTDPRKKAAIPFNRAADNFINGPEDVARAIAAVRARKPEHMTAREKRRAEVEAHFTTYHNVIAPFLDILQKMPPQNGLEFFVRADLYQSARSQQDSIRLWVLYGRESSGSFMTAGVPSTHDVGVANKNPASKQMTTHVALSARPVLFIEMKPAKDGGYSIESSIYQERYVRRGNDTPPEATLRGDFISNNDIIARRSHATLKDTLGALNDWLGKAVPERKDDIRAALGILDTPELKDDVTALRLPAIRKRPKP